MARPKRSYKCRACSGTGFEACRGCGGAGRKNVRKRSGRHRLGDKPGSPQPEVESETCPTCRGSGNGAKCRMCDGGRRTS